MPFVNSVRGSFGPQAEIFNKYPIVEPKGSTSTTGGTITTSGGYRIHTFTSTSDQTFTPIIAQNYNGSILPTGEFNPGDLMDIEMYVWGAGGGAGYNSGRAGGGGFATGKYRISSGTSLIVSPGQGGYTRNANAGRGSRPFNGGGHCGPAGYGGSGGGYSGIFISSKTQANVILMAGAGGGGSWENPVGGTGGGTNGGSGGSGSRSGGSGGTQSSGGSGPGGNGVALRGGDSGDGDGGGAGGGGSGYFGGGAGTNLNPGSGGGGGSGRIGSGVFNGSMSNASGRTPPETGNQYYGGSAGYGGNAGANAGAGGRIVIRYAI